MNTLSSSSSFPIMKEAQADKSSGVSKRPSRVLVSTQQAETAHKLKEIHKAVKL